MGCVGPWPREMMQLLPHPSPLHRERNRPSRDEVDPGLLHPPTQDLPYLTLSHPCGCLGRSKETCCCSHGRLLGRGDGLQGVEGRVEIGGG